MNTREREVMDALAAALRTSKCPAETYMQAAECESCSCDIGPALAAYDALLAEGSASSEGAEAVAYVPVHPRNGPLWANTTPEPNAERLPSYPLMPLYARPQPAQGEPERFCGTVVEGQQHVCAKWRDTEGRRCTTFVTADEIGALWRSQFAQGEREQRSCEGSERRPIADEVVERASFEAWMDRDWPLWRNDVDNPNVARLRRLYDSMQPERRPRGLPAGSDAKLADTQRAIIEAAEQRGYDRAVAERRTATAEQPSCGQDARDAARYRHIRRNDVHCDRFHHTVSDDCHPPTRQLKHGEELDAAIDAAIAAQQRQGGAP
ncbi:hypothetical protein FHW12_000296 [Dokdonella fugitiva]|uniref:Uncharacterized protein n=1 Tax=Dokdonella fugitiva TaxID=328517 RepID=A0A839EQT0_9GAMM|nr:hypothetical protein [Dokdonella fugitiva]MBA8886105.1 hypothetical protein [Dokdonella fugitiva]